MISQSVIRAAVCAALVAVCLAGAGWFTTRPAAGQEPERQSLRGAEALERLKQDGQYDSLQVAMRQARFGVSRAEETPLGRAAWQAPNPAAGYDAYGAESGVSVAVNNESQVSLQQKLAAADGAKGDSFGSAVALSGNTAVVGAAEDDLTYEDQGAVYVFTRNGATWTQQARLNASDGAESDFFGSSVAISGDTLMVGASSADIGANQFQGSVYVFTRSGSVWTQRQKLTAADGAANDGFGSSVALDGGAAVIGASRDTTGANASQGSAYVFTRSGETWTQQQKLTANDGAAEDRFGHAVALDGDTLVVGAFFDDIAVNNEQGSVYVFTRSGGAWTQRQKLAAADGGPGDRFGVSVVLGGDTLVVGAYLDDIGANVNQGSVYAYARAGATWVQAQKLTANDGAEGDLFSYTVALDGDTLLVGSIFDDIGANNDQGSAYVFARAGATWIQQRKLFAASGPDSDVFGRSLALDRGAALVGAPGGDAIAADQGVAYVFVIGDRHVERQKLTAFDGAATDYFGSAVALDGATLALAAPYAGVGANQDQGAVYIFTRQGETWALQQKIVAFDGAAYDEFGYAVALSGDTLMVGAPSDDFGDGQDQGSVYVFTRDGATWTPRQKLTAIDSGRGAWFGFAVSISGDRLVVGAPKDDVVGKFDQGSVYIFKRSGATWAPEEKLTAIDGARGEGFGYAVALDDGARTLAVGAPFDTIGANASQGSVYIFTRSDVGWTQQQKLTGSESAVNDIFGVSVALDGDTLAVGAPFDEVLSRRAQGSVYVFTRNVSAWKEQALLRAGDGEGYDRFGEAVALSGGVLLAGATGDDLDGNGNQGSVYVFTFNGNWILNRKLTASDSGGNDYFGRALALSGDTLIASASLDVIGANNDQGSAYVFVSPSCPALTLAPAGLPNGVIGASYQQALIVSGGAGTYQFTVSGGALPPGLTMSRDGLLAGSPMTPGEYHFTISATNSISLCAGSQEYAITVTPQCPTITLNPASLPSARQGAAYNQTLTVQSNATPHSFTVAAGALPPGLSLSAGGVLSGTPTQPGSYSFTARVTDANGCAGTRDYILVVSAPVTHVSAASYSGVTLAPDSIVAAFGANLATETRGAESLPLPTELGGASVTVRDSQGSSVRAPLFFVSPNQINYIMPSGLANGAATVTIANGQGAAIESQIQISAVAPGLFTANASGVGPASALALRVRANGQQQVYEPVARYDAQTQSFVLEPIDLSDPADQVYLILFGTGIRHRGSLQDVTVEVGGMKSPVVYADEASGLAGVDQINVLLPRSLAGRGEVAVSLSVAGKAANTVRVSMH